MEKEYNFYASFINMSKAKVKRSFELSGWSSSKASWTDFELVNDWAELILDGTDNEPLLHGPIVFTTDNIKVFDEIFGTLNCQYVYEVYDTQHKLILEKKNNTSQRPL